MKIKRAYILDIIAGKIFLVIGLTSIIILFLIILFLFKEGLPLFNFTGAGNFLTGNEWYPTSEKARFGIFSLIYASVSVTLLASLLSIPLSLALAIYLSEIASSSAREIIKPVIEIIASIPSVIIGFFGMVVIAPFLQDKFNLDTGMNLFNASLMLAFMAIPTIASISEDALSSVPMSLKEASYALGANKWQTIYHITIPAALSGIWTAVILGISRVIGETMVVLMVAGGSAGNPSSIFDSVRPLTSTIAAEMAETPHASNHYHALFAIGLVLFIITFVFNMLADYLSNKYKFKG